MFGERLQGVIKKLGYSGYSFAKAINQGNSKLYQIFRGEVSPSVKFCENVHSHFPEINWDWMITGRGEALLQPGETPTTYDATRVATRVAEKQQDYKKDYKELWEVAQDLVKLKREQVGDLKEKINRLEAELAECQKAKS